MSTLHTGPDTGEDAGPDTGRVWKALADPTRRHILDLLREQPHTTGQLVAHFSMSRVAVMKHLRILSEAGLVLDRKRGRERWHYLNFVPLQAIHERWFRAHEAAWSQSLLRLRERVEAAEVPMSNPSSSGMSLALDIEQELDIAGSADAVFRALTSDIACWWGRPYIAAEATDIILEPRLGGRLYEAWGDEEGSLLALVTALRRPTRLELTGRFHLGVVHSVANFRLSEIPTGIKLSFSHQAVGHLFGPAKNFQSGWGELLGRLKAYVDSGEKRGIASDATP